MELFLKQLGIKYNLDVNTITQEWKTFDEVNTKYKKMKKPELVEICKQHGYSHNGSKDEIIENIFNKVEMTVKPKKEPVPKQKPLQKDILTHLKANIPPLVIRRNKHGNYEHAETGYVFNHKNNEVLGKQMENGDIVSLTKDDIDICNKYNFSYTVPFNLSTNEEIIGNDEDIDELDEDLLVNQEEDEDSEEEIEYDE